MTAEKMAAEANVSLALYPFPEAPRVYRRFVSIHRSCFRPVACLSTFGPETNSSCGAFCTGSPMAGRILLLSAFLMLETLL